MSCSSLRGLSTNHDFSSLLSTGVGRMSARLGVCAAVSDPHDPAIFRLNVDFVLRALSYAMRSTLENVVIHNAATAEELDNLFHSFESELEYAVDALETSGSKAEDFPIAEEHVVSLFSEDPLPSIGLLPDGDQYLSDRIVTCLFKDLQQISDARDRRRLAALVAFTTASDWLPRLVFFGDIDQEEIEVILYNLLSHCALLLLGQFQQPHPQPFHQQH